MTNTTLQPSLVLVDAHGVYIPQLWCSDLDQEHSEAIGVTWTLHQDGDLWEVPEGFTFED